MTTIAVTGHIDHGKTALVEALTGTNTDTLAEEKKRGISIDIGVAYLKIDNNEPIALVDIPGHEKFLKNALCGIFGSKMAILVVSATEGPMPQTIEHLEILKLLNRTIAVAAISKVDLATETQKKRVIESVGELLERFGFGDAPIIEFSAATLEGRQTILERIYGIPESTLQKEFTHNNFCMHVDRSFSISGIGTIVTGIAAYGQLGVGDHVGIAGQKERYRIRGIRANSLETICAVAGQRTALNIVGLDQSKTQFGRGSVIHTAEDPPLVKKIDVCIVTGEGHGRIAHWDNLQIHMGTVNSMGRIALLDRASLTHSGQAFAQIHLDSEVCCFFGDRFILRDPARGVTVGAGRVVDVFPPSRGRSKPERLRALQELQCEEPLQALLGYLNRDLNHVDLGQFGRCRNLSPSGLLDISTSDALKVLEADKARLAFSALSWSEMSKKLRAVLLNWDNSKEPKEVPLQENIGVYVGTRFPRTIGQLIVRELSKEKVILLQGRYMRLPGQRIQFSESDTWIWELAEENFKSRFPRPLTKNQLTEGSGINSRKAAGFLKRAVERGWLSKISTNRYSTPQTLRLLFEEASELASASTNEGFDTSKFARTTGIGRNNATDILEFFDRSQLTTCVNGRRRLHPTWQENLFVIS